MSYSLAITISFLAILQGIRSVITNGFVHSSEFSAIMCTTRNKTLDNPARENSTNTKVGKEVRHTRLMLGVLRGEKAEERISFGVEGEVEMIRRRKV